MPRKRDPRRDQSFEIWKQNKGKITNREIAKRLNVDEKKIAVWKQRDKWNVVQQAKNNVVQQKKTVHKARVHKKRSGNPHPVKEFTKRNKAAEKFGFFSKYLPKESLEIMHDIEDRSPADMLWDQIMIQYTAIIRAQKIMLVKNHNDLTRELKRVKESVNADEHEYELQFAWDKQANFLMAQSRAMSELRALIKQFVAIADEADERRKKLELMQAKIDQVKADAEKTRRDLNGDSGDNGQVVINEGTDEMRRHLNDQREHS